MSRRSGHIINWCGWGFLDCVLRKVSDVRCPGAKCALAYRATYFAKITCHHAFGETETTYLSQDASLHAAVRVKQQGAADFARTPRDSIDRLFGPADA